MRNAQAAGRAILSGARLHRGMIALLGILLWLHPLPADAKPENANSGASKAPANRKASASIAKRSKARRKAKRRAHTTAAKKTATAKPTAKQHAKHVRQDAHAAAVRTTSKSGTVQVAAQHQRSTHSRKAKRHHTRVAVRHHDPAKLIIPQGDGSPVLSVAAQYLGRPYHFGAEGRAFDCSGFVRTVFADMGVDVPHSARELSTLGDRIDREELEPGDLVFFRNTRRHSASHVGIYVGDDKFVHAATRGGQVQVDSLSDSYYAQHYLCARRIEI